MKILNFIIIFISETILLSYMIYKTSKIFLDMKYMKKYNKYLDKVEPKKYLQACIEVKKTNPNACNKEIYEYLINQL